MVMHCGNIPINWQLPKWHKGYCLFLKMSHICLYNDKRNIRNDQNECNISLIVGCQASIEYLYKQVMKRATGTECDVS